MMDLSTQVWPLVALLLMVLTLPGTLLLLMLTLAALWPARKVGRDAALGRIAVVVPAHNERAGIGRTLANLLDEARADGDAQVVVIADNCSDDTAQRAGQCGARVLSRCDSTRCGKGFALDFAFRTLLAEEFRYFVVVDADSVVSPGFLAAFRRHFAAGADVLQARYTVLNAGESVRTRLMNLALCAFNVVRPRGRDALGFSCGLLGNGFGVTRRVLERIPYSAGSVVEDLEYHLVLVWHGVRVRFVDEAQVAGEMPPHGAQARSQRARWEGGRLRMLAQHAGGLLRDLARGRLSAIEPLADLLLLPLSYHVVLLLALCWAPWARGAAVAGLLVVGLHLVVAARVGRLPWRQLGALVFVPFYVLWKLALVPATLSQAGRNAPWIRTARERAREGVK